MIDEPDIQSFGSHPATAAFERFYNDADSGWGGNSGPGSNAYFTIEYRAFLEKFISMNQVRTVTDIGCGDWQFSRLINFDGVRYLGFDVVGSLITNNQARFQSDFVSFQVMPEDYAEIPAGDLLLMKDVLQHLPDSEIKRLERDVFRRFKHVLLTNSYAKHGTPQNVAIEAGSFRCLDLAAPPFSFRGAYLLEFGSSVWERLRTFYYRPD